MNLKAIILLFLLASYALAYLKEKRKPKGKACNGLDCEDNHGHKGECKDPCQDCEERNITTKTWTPVHLQQVEDRSILICSNGSYFDRIEYDGCYEWNTTCSGVMAGSDHNVQGVYTGIRRDHLGKQIFEVLNAKSYKWVASHNQGNTIIWERAELEECKCYGDVLKAVSNWADVDDPINGCCGKGVKHQQATAYTLNIYGICCSQCNLLGASIIWNKPIKNN